MEKTNNACGSCMMGASPHFLLIVRHHLNQTFGEQRTGRGGTANCSAWSPDLNPLDFWLWEHLKALVYSAPINDLGMLQQQVEKACQEIGVKPGIFDRGGNSVRRRAEICVEMFVNHTEHLLQRSHENCPYLSRHRFLDICWLQLFCSLKWLPYHFKPVTIFKHSVYKMNM
jgi:hypothetical protein